MSNGAADTNSFREEIQRRLDKSQAALESQRQQMGRNMAELEEREQQFNHLANQLLYNAVRPTLEEFASHLENASMDDTGPVPRIRCNLRHCVRFPALAHVEFTITRSVTIQEGFAVHYHAEILPVFIQFNQDDEYRVAIDAPNRTALTKWIEQKLLSFLDAYLQIETHAQYQRTNAAIDPVCGMQVTKVEGLTYSHGGKTYYFCTQHCVDRFAAQPEQFLGPNVE